MGLKVDMVNATFDTIIPGLSGGKYDMGASSFTDTVARQKVVNFVDYFLAGYLVLHEVKRRHRRRRAGGDLCGKSGVGRERHDRAD